MSSRTRYRLSGGRSAARTCRCHVCRPDGRYDPVERRTLDTVRRHGWQVMLVSGDGCCEAPEHWGEHGDGSGGPDFAYTVGLGHRCGHPELVVSGLDPRSMYRVLQDVATRVAGGLRLRPGDMLEGLLADAPMAVASASSACRSEVVSWSGWFHRRAPDALVLVWPTAVGAFPWQPGAPAFLDERQPPAWRVCPAALTPPTTAGGPGG